MKINKKKKMYCFMVKLIEFSFIVNKVIMDTYYIWRITGIDIII